MLSLSLKNIGYKIKGIVLPIHKSELKLFVPMALMMFCILFNFSALRSVKDGLVVSSIGAEVISFLKLWLVLPASVIFTIIYVKISNILDFEYIFYAIITFFLLFFLVFAYLIYPNQELYHPTDVWTSQIILDYPNFQWFIRILEKWSYALMYIFSELWSAVVINLMFWQFANHIFNTETAKRFYPILGMIGNLGLITSGSMLVHLIPNGCALNHSDSSNVLQSIILMVVFLGIVSIGLFWFINHVASKDYDIKVNCKISESTRTKLSLLESVKLIINSKYIGYIVVLILCYGLLINIVEGPWKAKVRTLYPTTIEYVYFMGKFNIWMGISCVVFMVIGSNVLRHLSWLISAMLTPIMFALTGVTFFLFVIFAKDSVNIFGIVDPVYAAIIVGAVQNILSKSTKYSLFDSTKEIAYIPLSLELRTKGKAAVEVIGIKFGKSIGALIQSSVFMIAPYATFDSISHYLLIIFIAITALWMYDVIKLNKAFLEIKQSK